MSIKKFLSIDGALNNFGFAKGYFVGNRIVPQHIHLVRTKGQSNQRQLNDARRMREIARVCQKLSVDVDIIFAELPGGTKSYRAAWSLGAALAIIATLQAPVQFVNPMQAKSATGNRKAKKQQVISWAYRKWPDLEWLKSKKGTLYNYNEHMADALAIAVAGLQNYGDKKYIK